MKEILLAGYGLPSFGKDDLIPVSFVKDDTPAVAFLPATVVECMAMMKQSGQVVNMGDPMFADQIRDCTSVIFINPASLLAIHNMTGQLLEMFTTTTHEAMN